MFEKVIDELIATYGTIPECPVCDTECPYIDNSGCFCRMYEIENCTPFYDCDVWYGLVPEIEEEE